MMDFFTLKERYRCKPIPGCPGRYILEGAEDIPPEKLAGGWSRASLAARPCNREKLPVLEYSVETAPDRVFVVKLEEGGIISYLKPNSTYVHTLNTEEGFRRKLYNLEIEICKE